MQDNSGNSNNNNQAYQGIPIGGSLEGQVNINEIINKAVSKAVEDTTARLTEEFNNKNKTQQNENIGNAYDVEINKRNKIGEVNKRVDEFTQDLAFVKHKLPSELEKFKSIVGENTIASFVNVNDARLMDNTEPKEIIADTFKKFFEAVQGNKQYFSQLSNNIKNRILSGKYHDAFEDIIEYETNILNAKISSNTNKDPLGHLWDILDKKNNRNRS